MTNQELKEKYHIEKGYRWYENMADYANWLEDIIIDLTEIDEKICQCGDKYIADEIKYNKCIVCLLPIKPKTS